MAIKVRQILAVGVCVFCCLAHNDIWANDGEETVTLTGLTTGMFRWMDVGSNLYSDAYRETYSYTQALVRITFVTNDTLLCGTLTATNLKPNFAYQLKLSGLPEDAPAANEALGFSGRWWKEEWGGTKWINGWNLNDKGTGSSPTPNDQAYLSLRDVTDPSSPTGRKYRFTGYRPFGYFITDADGAATVTFTMRDAYHVLWGNWQGAPSANDGPLVWHMFDPDPASHPAYTTNYPATTRGVFGEWERLPKGKVYLASGTYRLDFQITEESFHESGLGGTWAHALLGEATFTIVQPMIAATVSPERGGTVSIATEVALACGASTNITITPAAYWVIEDVAVDGISQGAVSSWTFTEVVSNRAIRATFHPLLATNGVPQWWLAARDPAWATDFDTAALDDPDGDGEPTWAEYKAGTDPLDRASRFAIATAGMVNGTFRLVWLSPLSDPDLPPFVVMRSTNLVDWSVISEAVRATDGTNVWQEATPPFATGTVLYRLAVP